MPPRSSAEPANRPAYNTASAKLAVRKILNGRSKNIARAPNCVDQLWLAFQTDFGTKPTHMGLDDLGFRVKMKVPDPLEQHCSGYHALRVAHEAFKQSEFSRLELEIPAASFCAMCNQVKLKIGYSQCGLYLGQWRSTRQGMQSSEEL